jgi:MFS family permease
MATPSKSEPATSTGAWMALVAALLGWLFDGAEMGIFSMVGRSAVQDMLGIDGKPTAVEETQIGFLFGIIIAVFLVGAATGGVLFGWLGDRIGRVRAMSLSVLTYAIFTGLCGFAQSPIQLGILRFIASLGMGGEWALGVALVMEVWPNKSRALMAGLIGAAANAGYMVVGFVGMGLNAFLEQDAPRVLGAFGLSSATITMLTAHRGWRLMMMLGTLPAVLTFFFRIFVPESHKWEEEKAKGSTSHWSAVDLLGVVVGALGPGLIVYLWSDANRPGWMLIAGTFVGLAIAVVGYTYPVMRYLGRAMVGQAETSPWPTVRRMLLGAGLASVALLGTWGSTQWAPTWAAQLTHNAHNSREWTLVVLSIGAIAGTIVAALAGDWLGRRVAYCVLCATSLVSVLAFYQRHTEYNASFLIWAFVMGFTTASFYGWLPLYLPELFATRVRATGQGFAFNFGRIVAAIGTLQMGALLPFFKDDKTFVGVQGGYPVACSYISAVYLVGLVLIWFAPETKGKPLPE